MQHKVKWTVTDKKLHPELQAKRCADPNSGPCPCYNIGDEFLKATVENCQAYTVRKLE
ncbi:MAG: TIGR04076 family protein [Lachnospiraceae bacterium]|nr:TIGR04076 family protein [Lachnospiraceae bacterium]